MTDHEAGRAHSGQADVGYGVETPARQFKLDFVANQTERYFLLCNEASLESDTVQRMLAILCSAVFKAAVDLLPGYQVDDSGSVLDLGEVFTELRAKPGRSLPR